MPRVTICGNCKHWVDVQRALLKSQQKGQCRRYPPIIDALIKHKGNVPEANYPGTGFYWHCGEFKKK